MPAVPSTRAGPTLRRYLAREALGPIALAAGGLTLVIATREWVALADGVVNRGVGAGEALRIAGLDAVAVGAGLVPFAALVGVLVALGRWSADRELLALEACGLAPRALRGAAARLALGLALASAVLALGAGPWAVRSRDAVLDAVARRQPWTPFHAGAVSRFGAWRVEAREVSPAGDELRGVSLWVPEVRQTLFARRAAVARAAGGGVDLTLGEGALLLPPTRGALELRFDALRASLPPEGDASPGTDGVGGLGLRELRERARGGPPGLALRAGLELQRRLAEPAATALLVLWAAQLFRLRRLSSRSAAAALGIAATVAYLALAQLGEGLAAMGALGAAAGAWLPNAGTALALVALALRARRAERGAGPRGRGGGGGGGAGAAVSRPGPRRGALPRYVAARYARLALACFAALFVAYLFVDVLERLDWFARYGASGAEVARFYAARAWLLAARAVPMALLAATALLVSLLGREGELVGMRASGLSTARALAPAGLVALAVTPAYFALCDAVLPRTNALADLLKRTEIKADAYRALAEEQKTAVWRRAGSRLLEAARFDPDAGVGVDLTLYELGADGLPRSRSDAASARHLGGGVWRLDGARRVEVAAGSVREVPAQPYVALGDALPADVDSMHLSLAALSREIASLEAAGYDATALRVDWHAKLAAPLACLVLPAAVLFFALGGPPFPRPAAALLAGAALGAGWVLLGGVAGALGRSGALSPPVAGWTPPAAFAALAAALARRVRG